MISNIIITSMNVSERSERALGDIALSRLKLGARLMMRGKGGTLIEGIRHLLGNKKEHVSKYKGLLSEVKMGTHQG